MRRRLLLASFVIGLGFISGCSSSSSSDSQLPEPDADTTADSQSPEAGTDSAPSQSDSAADQSTADQSTEDHSSPEPDATGDGPGPDQAAGDSAPDGPVQQEGLIRNGGFESWSDSMPDSWIGDKSTVPPENVTQSTASHQGAFAARVANPTDSHVRFTSSPMSLGWGSYSCTYWVKGKGEIRNAHFHGLSGNGFSSYSPSGFNAINSTDWRQLSYEFTLPADVTDVFELIFSIRNTDAAQGDLQLDDVVCERKPSACDTITCDDWAQCNPTTSQCEPRSGFCGDGGDCWGWEQCSSEHRCELAPGRCNATIDCAGTPSTPVCNRTSHTCEAGDPCAGVTCPAWKQCDTHSGTCLLSAGRCETTADCQQQLPACDVTTHQCQSVDHACNLVRNGGFEVWVDNGYGHSIPDYWFGMDIPGSTEIDPSNALAYTTSTHSGQYACQLIQTGIAERFTTEAFDIPPGNYTCSYWVRGHGEIRHRYYSLAGWSPYVDWTVVDSTSWTQKTFSIAGNVRDFRLIFYASYTQADKDHIQLDDVVCTRN